MEPAPKFNLGREYKMFNQDLSQLSREWREVAGAVEKGLKIGQKIGFPTININIDRQKLPEGVFPAVICFGGRIVLGMAYHGQKKTFNGSRLIFEVHLFDFKGDLYGQMVRVKLGPKIREGRKFTDLAALRAQLKEDMKVVKKKCFPG